MAEVVKKVILLSEEIGRLAWDTRRLFRFYSNPVFP